MSKRMYSPKAMWLWIALSTIVIIAGVVLYVLFGFNVSASEYRTIEVGYDSVVSIEKLEEDLRSHCEKSFASAGISQNSEQSYYEVDVNYLQDTGTTLVTYFFSADTAEAGIKSAVSAIESAVASDAKFANADVTVEYRNVKNEPMYEAIWRGAIGVAVGVVVALVYIGFRFGWDGAITGLIVGVHDALLTLALLAITRIPVYAYAPLLFAAVASMLGLLLWMIRKAKMREDFKDPAYSALSAEEAVEESCRNSYKTVLCFAVPLAVALIVLGAVATAGVRMFMLPALVPLAVSVYSSLLLAPAVYAPLKAKFDRFKTRHKRYFGKKKVAAEEE